MRTVYLIDTENLKSESLKGCELVGKNDEIIICLGDGIINIPIDTALNLRECKAKKIDMLSCGVGTKNALDFQLVSHLGYMIKGAPKTKYVIVSKDKGFSILTNFWKVRGVDVKTFESIKDAIDFENKPKDENGEAIDDEKTLIQIAQSNSEIVVSYDYMVTRLNSILGKILANKKLRVQVAGVLPNYKFSDLEKIKKLGVNDFEYARIRDCWPRMALTYK